MNFPSDLLYTKDHEWIRVEGDVGVVGITDHAQSALGDVVFVDLPGSGTRVESGKPFGSIESVKAVSDLFAPASGEVLEVNTALESAPEIVNRSCYGEGWMIRVRIADRGELDRLLKPDAYRKIVEESH